MVVGIHTTTLKTVAASAMSPRLEAEMVLPKYKDRVALKKERVMLK